MIDGKNFVLKGGIARNKWRKGMYKTSSGGTSPCTQQGCRNNWKPPTPFEHTLLSGNFIQTIKVFEEMAEYLLLEDSNPQKNT